MMPPDAATDPRAASLLAEVLREPRRSEALRARLAALAGAEGPASAALGVRLFEGVWPLLPPFDDARATALAADLYDRIGQPEAARLLRPAPPEAAVRHPRAAALLALPKPDADLLAALAELAGARDWAGLATLFEDVFRRRPALGEKWLFHRAADAYAALGQTLPAMLMAGIAVQLDPAIRESDGPYRRLLDWFLTVRGWKREAALLCRQRAALCPDWPLLDPPELAALLAEAGPVPEPPQPAIRRSLVVASASVRRPMPWRSYPAVHPDLRALLGDMPRAPVRVSELDNATVLIDRGAMAVFGADGAPLPEFSLRAAPASVCRSLAGRRDVALLSADIAVVVADEHASDNLCHFALDHVTRLVLYRRAGVDLSRAVAIGPPLRADYQRLIGARMGMPPYVEVTRRARIEVGRLFVASNCRQLQHPAHWGSEWAATAVRDALDPRPRGPARRLLVSRADVARRQIVNEAELAALLKQKEFDVVTPGRMPFAEQVAAFRDATHVVGAHGAALTNIVFCAPGARVLEIFPPLYGTWAYAMTAQALGLDYASMTGRDGHSDDPALNDPDRPRARHDEFIEQHIRADLDLVRAWLKDIGL